jgi:hypothetical protein
LEPQEIRSVAFPRLLRTPAARMGGRCSRHWADDGNCGGQARGDLLRVLEAVPYHGLAQIVKVAGLRRVTLLSLSDTRPWSSLVCARLADRLHQAAPALGAIQGSTRWGVMPGGPALGRPIGGRFSAWRSPQSLSADGGHKESSFRSSGADPLGEAIVATDRRLDAPKRVQLFGGCTKREHSSIAAPVYSGGGRGRVRADHPAAGAGECLDRGSRQCLPTAPCQSQSQSQSQSPTRPGPTAPTGALAQSAEPSDLAAGAGGFWDTGRVNRR